MIKGPINQQFITTIKLYASSFKLLNILKPILIDMEGEAVIQ